MEPTPDPVPQVRVTFQRVLADGLRNGAVSGASPEQIDDMAAAQQVTELPVALREVYRLIGARPGLWLAGSSFGAAMDGRMNKAHALAALRQALAPGWMSDPFADAEGMYVLVSHQAYSYQVIDGADLDSADPPVWLIEEGEAVVRRWDTVSAWFAATAPDVKRYRERLKIMLELGDNPPRWALDIQKPR